MPDLSEADRHILQNYLMGGLAVGGAAGTGVSLVHYLKNLQQASGEDTSEDDDILYLNLPQAQKQAASLGIPSAALAGSVLTGLGGYALVRGIYKKFRKQQLQKELDDAQQAYIGMLETEAGAMKSARDRAPTLTETALSVPGAAMLLMALASGVVTHKTLEKNFPRAEAPTRVNPRRVIIRRNKSKVEDSPEEEVIDLPEEDVKMANYKDALECLTLTVLGDSQRVKKSALADIVGAVSQGRLGEVCDNVNKLGWEGAVELIKGASLPQDDALLGMSVRACIENKNISEGFGLIATSEYSDMAPNYVKAASNMNGPMGDALLGIAATMQTAHRKGICDLEEGISKEASVNQPGLGEALDRFFAVNGNQS